MNIFLWYCILQLWDSIIFEDITLCSISQKRPTVGKTFSANNFLVWIWIIPKIRENQDMSIIFVNSTLQLWESIIFEDIILCSISQKRPTVGKTFSVNNFCVCLWIIPKLLQHKDMNIFFLKYTLQLWESNIFEDIIMCNLSHKTLVVGK